jgi:hypothetical protein
MYVCIYVCVYVCVYAMIQVHTDCVSWGKSCMYVCICTYVYVYAMIQVHMDYVSWAKSYVCARMHVCMYMYTPWSRCIWIMYVILTHIYIYTHTQQSLQMWSICTQSYVRKRIRTCICKSILLCIYARMCICVYACIRKWYLCFVESQQCGDISMHMCVCIYIYIHTYIYVHINVYTYACICMCVCVFCCVWPYVKVVSGQSTTNTYTCEMWST